jgi:hypothetical protein
MMADLLSVTLKWLRAREHLKTVEDSIESFGKANPCTIVPQINPNTHEKMWRVEGKPLDPPQLLNPFIGDTLYNYRSALDHLAHQLVLRAGGTPTWDTAFPIMDDIHKFKSNSPAKLAGMSKPMKAAIKKLQPCYRNSAFRDPILWALESLGNIDKHRHFNLTLCASDGGIWIPGLPVWSDNKVFIYSGPIEDGTVLASVPQEYMDVDFHPAYGIAFDQGWPTAREVLFGINEIVAGIIETFALAFFETSISLQRW